VPVPAVMAFFRSASLFACTLAPPSGACLSRQRRGTSGTLLCRSPGLPLRRRLEPIGQSWPRKSRRPASSEYELSLSLRDSLSFCRPGCTGEAPAGRVFLHTTTPATGKSRWVAARIAR
jgi:hypothetical protein